MITRRRALSIIASASFGVSALPLIGTNAYAKATSWRGIALGADAQIILDHENSGELISLALKEITRLEKIFSLYDKDSEISILNAQGKLKNPAPEFVELLSIASTINHRTNGAFDPTIQPLWAAYAKSFSKGNAPSKEDIARVKNIIGWQGVNYSAEKISFAKMGMSLTLNGIAQGYIADRISNLFKRNGITNVLINTGEIVALGHSPQEDSWQIKINNSDKSIALNNFAIATSAPLGTVFDQKNKISHIIDPRTGEPSLEVKQVSVIAKSATIADGLSTGFCLMSEKEINLAKRNEQIIIS